ncbi:hypothetical protein FOCC_FOCC015753 [Frankliniella occidentalis]|uniref:Beta-sarcoglycan n=1 Tax=Frankliniella occidentalis TaxID=133901 RepID=A0A6J1S8Z5_FRAOC|nr:beta-sarcoglycan [Frankliniella occidentalis]KAE8738743.1 hypothetical protein FOCC_FOCC015753 [Frankliniella occidentalis]
MTESQSDQGTLSLRNKSLIKRNMNRNHSNNMRAGYVAVNEQYLHKTGLRGRKTYAFWTLIMLLFFMAIGNLMLTFTILGVLRLGQGMESLELVPEASLIKFFGAIDLDKIYKRDGKLEGFHDAPLELTGNNGSVIVKLVETGEANQPKLVSNQGGTTIQGIKSFDIHDPKTGQTIFSTDFPNFGLPQGVEKLDIKLARTHRIVSPIDKDLTLSAESYVRIKGIEGTHMDGKQILWKADQDIFLKSVNGSVILDAPKGIFLDVKNMPIATSESNKPGKPVTLQYKVCVCVPNGKVFRVPVVQGLSHKNSGCNYYSSEIDPCM